MRSATPARGPEPILGYHQVTFAYPDTAPEHPALRDVTIAIDEGSFALAAGATGSGKSTFLRAANGLVPQFTGGTFAGHVLTQGRDTRDHPPRRMADVVAFVPQDPGASFVLDLVEDELAYGMENLGVPPAHMRRRIEEMLDLLDLEPLRRRSIRTLSGGERQRVAIAAALAAGPRLLVLDEPTSQLDPQAAEHVVAALQRLVHDQAMTVLLAEHRLERVAGAVDVALGFQQGNVRLGTPAEVIARLELGPPVAHLGRMLGWDPVPLTVREARQRGGSLPAAARSASTSTSTPAAGSELVHIHNAWLRHGDAAAVRGIDLSLGEGEIVALLGRNGAGKTTLLRGIAGVHRPAKGSIQIRADGDDLHDPDPGVDTALCPQEPETLLFADTVGAELRATLRGHAKRTARRVVPDGAIGDTLAALGIDDLAGAHPRDLSAGQRLLVAVAAVAVSDTPVLLLDEPTRGLDPTVKGRLTAFLQDRGRRGGLVCVATHDFELAAAIATRVVVLAGGEIVADGDPGEVLGDSLVFAPQMTRAFGRGWLTPEQVAGALS